MILPCCDGSHWRDTDFVRNSLISTGSSVDEEIHGISAR
jgi:hypothetical protein